MNEISIYHDRSSAILVNIHRIITIVSEDVRSFIQVKHVDHRPVGMLYGDLWITAVERFLEDKPRL
jgi:hypothetical protein